MLGSSIEENLEPTPDWLQTRLDLDEAQLRKVVLVRPSLLGCERRGKPCMPTLEWLQTPSTGRRQLKKVVLVRPTLLGLSVEDKCGAKARGSCRSASTWTTLG